MNHEKKNCHTSHHSHASMVQDFKKRFWISIILTLPILLLSPMIHHLFGIHEAATFAGDIYLLFGFSTLIFFYGGWPFLKGAFNEVKDKSPGMMTLIGLAISVAYFYSTAIVFGLEGEFFFGSLPPLLTSCF